MKKLFMLPALFALAVTGCGGDDPSPVDTQWAQELKTEMTQYLGLVLPYVQFNQDTLYHRWDTTDNAYIIGDYQETSVLDDYGTRLTRTGWTATTTTEGLAYVKTTEVGELTLFADFYEADDEYPAGNEIAVYVDEEGGGGGETVTGTYEFIMYEMGWEHEETNPTVVVDPGLLIEADQGNNPNDSGKPKYWDTDLTLRLYSQNTLTLSADNITGIEFTFNTIKNNQTMTANTGSITAFSNTGALWSGDTDSVTFTLGDVARGQIHILKIKVTGTFSGGGVTPIEPSDRTPLSVAMDIAYNLFGEEVDYETDIEIDGSDYYVTASSPLTSEKDTVEAGKAYLPDYVELDTDTTEDTEDEMWYAIYIDEDFMNNGIVVQINSYTENGSVILEYLIYDYWSEMVYE